MGVVIAFAVLGILVFALTYAWAKSERRGGQDNAIKKALQKAYRIKTKAEQVRAEPLDSGPDLLDDWGNVRDDGDN